MEVGVRSDPNRALFLGLKSKVDAWGVMSRKGRLYSNSGGPWKIV